MGKRRKAKTTQAMTQPVQAQEESKGKSCPTIDKGMHPCALRACRATHYDFAAGERKDCKQKM